MKKRAILLLVLLALALAAPCLAAEVVGPDGAVRTVTEPAAQPDEPAGLFAAGETVTQNGVTYAINGSEAQVAGYTADIPQACVIPASITVSGTEYPVTALADNALYNCAKITSIDLPDTVTTLGNKSLAGCTGLTEITIPAGVTRVANHALKDCSALASITVAEGNTSYTADGAALFDARKKLQQYALGSTQTDYVVPEGTTAIGECAFQGARSLRSVTLPDSVKRLESSAFFNCKALTDVDLGEGVESIMESFAESGLTRLHLPASVKEVNNDPFRDCEDLTAFTVDEANPRYYAQDGVLFDREYVDQYSGVEEPSLTLIAYPAGNPRTSYAVPQGVKGVGYSAFWSARALTTLTLPEGLEFIQDSAITDCGLTHLEIPDSVTTLGHFAVQTCPNMTAATLGTGITEIPEGLFSICESLRSVNIPAGVTAIGNEAFNRCVSLETFAVDEANTAFQSVGGVVYNKAGTRLVLCPATVKQITIPAAVTEIVNGAFTACSELTAFQVAEGNETFYAEDGVLFQKDSNGKKTLHTYPAGKTSASYTVPAGVTALAARALYNTQHLAELNTNDVTDIGEWALYNKSVTKLTLPKVEQIEQFGIYATHAAYVVLPTTLQSIGFQAFDWSDHLEYITFTGQTPPSIPGIAYNCPLRYVYVPVGTQVAYKNALAGNIAPGAMIVEGTYVPQASVDELIDALDAASAAAEVNAAAAGVVRLLRAEQDALSDADLAKVDDLFAAAHADTLTVAVDQTAVTDAAIEAKGLAVASGLVERQADGAVSGAVKLTAVQQEGKTPWERLTLDLDMTVNSAPVQPQSPVLLTVTLPAGLAGQDFKLLHRDGKVEEEIDYTLDGNKATFRAKAFSSYVFRIPNDKWWVDCAPKENTTLYVAGYQEGRMVDIACPTLSPDGLVEFAGQAGLTYKAFLLDNETYVSAGLPQVILPD